MTPTPYVTSNRSLAIALHEAEVPILEILNIYTPEMLKRWGFKTAVEAVAAHRLGNIQFHIARTERLGRLLEVFDQEMARTDDENFTPDEDTPWDELIIMHICHSQKTRLAIDKAIKDPCYAYEMHGSAIDKMRDFSARENAIRKKLRDAGIYKGGPNEDQAINTVLSTDEVYFISTEHQISGTATLVNALSKTTRKHFGL